MEPHPGATQRSQLSQFLDTQETLLYSFSSYYCIAFLPLLHFSPTPLHHTHTLLLIHTQLIAPSIFLLSPAFVLEWRAIKFLFRNGPKWSTPEKLTPKNSQELLSKNNRVKLTIHCAYKKSFLQELNGFHWTVVTSMTYKDELIV